MIQSAPASAPAAQTSTVPARFCGSGTRAASAAQARPLSTSAPSPPMMISPARAGMATHRAVSIRGAARCSVFCHENQLPKAPWYSTLQASSGLTSAAAKTNRPNSSSAARMASTGSSASRSAARMADQPIEPTTPSTR